MSSRTAGGGESEWRGRTTASGSYADTKSGSQISKSIKSATESYLSRAVSVNTRSGWRPQGCAQWVEAIEQFYDEDCEHTFAEAAAHFERERMKTKKFSYARSLTGAEAGDKEKFFANITLLVERKTDNSERAAILIFLAELCAIESKDESISFGLQALQCFVGLVLSITTIRGVLLEVIKKKLAEIVCQMSEKHLFNVISHLDKIIRHPKYGKEAIQCFADYEPPRKAPSYIRGDVKGSDASLRTFAGRLVKAHDHVAEALQENDTNSKKKQDMYRFMALCATNEKIARVFWMEFDGKRLSLEEKRGRVEKSRRGKLDYSSSSQLAKVLSRKVLEDKNAMTTQAAKIELRANIARFCRIGEGKYARYHAAERFARVLPEMIKLLDKHASNDKATKSHQLAYQAALVSCIGAIWMRTVISAATKVKIPKPRNPFITMFLRLAKRTPNGRLIYACLDLIKAAIIDLDELKSYREVLETQVSFGVTLQTIVKNLIVEMRKRKNQATPDEQLALAKAIDIMHYYNVNSRNLKQEEKRKLQSITLTNKFNSAEIKGYDREEIVFKVLESQVGDGTFDGTVRLAAARCIGSVPLQQFSAGEIRRVVTILAKMSTQVSDATYAILTHIVYLMVRLADQSDDDTQGQSSKVGDTFREIYAAEVVATIFQLLSRCSSREVSPLDAKFVEDNQRACLCACVKFLMLAWERRELRDGMATEANRATFCRIMRVEQSLLRYAIPEAFALHRHVLIEQTFLGTDIEALLQVLEELIDADVVAFRIFHQIANVLAPQYLHSGRIPAFDENEMVLKGEGRNLIRDLSTEKEKGFDAWNECRCGTELHDIKLLEALPLETDEDTNKHTADLPPQGQSLLIGRIADLIVNHLKDTYRLKQDRISQLRSASLDLKIKDWIVKAHSRDHKEVTLIVTNEDVISGVLHGGPIDMKRTKKFAPDGSEVFNEGFAEVYHFFIDPRSDGVAVAQALLSEFSHRMRTAGFSHCLAWAHNEERGYFTTDNPDGDVIRGEKLESKQLRPYMVKERLKKLRTDQKGTRKGEYNSKEVSLDNGGGDIEREFLRVWKLDNNVWQRNDAHKTFLEKSGIEKMAKFLSLLPEVKDEKHSPEETDVYRVRAALESQNFGTELMLLLKDSNVGGPKHDNIPKIKKSQNFEDLVTQALINDPDVVSRLSSLGPPSWSLFLSGTDSENYVCVKSITPFPAPPPLPTHRAKLLNPHAGVAHFFHTRIPDDYKDDEPWLSDPVKLSKNNPAKLEDYERKIKESYSNWEAEEQEKRAHQARDKRVVEDMKPQHRSMSAAFIRVLYTLMAKSSRSTREKTAKILRDPKLFRNITNVLASFDYEIDTSVGARLPDKLKCASKFLLLTNTLTDISPQGHEECLNALDFYEVIAECIKAIVSRLQRLVESRDFDNSKKVVFSLTGVIPQNLDSREGRLKKSDEDLMATVTTSLDDLMKEVLQLTFFNGKDKKIHEGNLKCRRRAIKAMFLDDSPLVPALMSLLRYDAEVSSNADLSKRANEKKGHSKGEEQRLSWNSDLEPLDVMRIRALSVLSSLMVSSETFAYNFFRRYATGAVKAAVGMRQSFVHDLMRATGRDALRAELESRMMRMDGGEMQLHKGEIIEYITFVVIEGCTYLLVCGNGERWFLSKRPLNPEYPHRVSDDFVASMEEKNLWGEFLFLKAYDYGDVRGIYRAKGDQIFAIFSTDPSTGNPNCTVCYSEVYGEASRIVDVFTRYCRDDLNRALLDPPPVLNQYTLLGTIKEEEKEKEAKSHSKRHKGSKDDFHDPSRFFKIAIQKVFERARLPKNCREKAYTYCMLNGSRVLLIWAGSKKKDKQSLLVCSSVDNSWEPQYPVSPSKAAHFIALSRVINLEDMISVEFPDESKATMRLFHFPGADPGKRSPYVEVFTFACDTAREMWRRQVHSYISAFKPDERSFDTQNYAVKPQVGSTIKYFM